MKRILLYIIFLNLSINAMEEDTQPSYSDIADLLNQCFPLNNSDDQEKIAVENTAISNLDNECKAESPKLPVSRKKCNLCGLIQNMNAENYQQHLLEEHKKIIEYVQEGNWHMHLPENKKRNKDFK